MRAAARVLGSAFETVDMRVEKGRSLRLVGTLTGEPTLQEVCLLSELDDRYADEARRSIRAFRAHGNGLQHDGVRDGDYILVDSAREATPGVVVVARIAGEAGIARVRRNDDGTLGLTSPRADTLPLAHAARGTEVIGVFAGIIRKRGFAARKISHEGATAPASATTSLRPLGKVTILRGKLGMLEMTCAATKNPRLRRALRNEANRVRRLLQNEAAVAPE